MAKASSALKALRKAERAIEKRIRILGEKALRSNLEAFCGDDICEAYEQGVQEAHSELLARIRTLVRDQQRSEDRSASPQKASSAEG